MIYFMLCIAVIVTLVTVGVCWHNKRIDRLWAEAWEEYLDDIDRRRQEYQGGRGRTP